MNVYGIKYDFEIKYNCFYMYITAKKQSAFLIRVTIHLSGTLCYYFVLCLSKKQSFLRGNKQKNEGEVGET